MMVYFYEKLLVLNLLFSPLIRFGQIEKGNITSGYDYYFDTLGNKIQENTYSPLGELISKEIWKYNKGTLNERILYNFQTEKCSNFTDPFATNAFYNPEAIVNSSHYRYGNNGLILFLNKTSDGESINNCKYDDNGFLIEEEYVLNNKQLRVIKYRRNIQGVLLEKEIFNSEGKLIEDCSYNTNGKPVERNDYGLKGTSIKAYNYGVESFSIDNRNKYAYRKKDNEESNLSRKYIYQYDDNSLLVCENEYYSESYAQNYINWSYDDFGNIIREERRNSYRSGTTKTYYFEYDEQNNWVAKYCYFDDVLISLTTRKITYY